MAKKTKPVKRKSTNKKLVERNLNVIPSRDYHKVLEYNYNDFISGQLGVNPIPLALDLRNVKWTIKDQGGFGSCVGMASAALLEYHLTKTGKILNYDPISPRLIWCGAKEFDEWSIFPEGVIESSGTSLLAAIKILAKFGSVPDKILPLDGARYFGSASNLYSLASKFKISGYNKIPITVAAIKQWLNDQGPLMIAVQPNTEFMNCNKYNPILKNSAGPYFGGHAINLCGWRSNGDFIIRNSWGRGWGSDGFAYATPDYILRSVSEAFGIF